jgi:uncharacterized protein YndB with AHSA1/START domain
VPNGRNSISKPRFEPADSSLEIVVDRIMVAAPKDVFRAWTEQFDTWFAAPGSLKMTAKVGEPFNFETEHEGIRHPHYGKFLELEPDRLVGMTWVTGRNGTWGAETVVRLEISPAEPGSRIRLTHGGFYAADAANQHGEAWLRVLEHLDDVLSETH